MLGSHWLAEERGQCSAVLEQRLQTHEAQERSVTLLMGDAGVLAAFAVADTIKPGLRERVAQPRALDVTPVLLSGDNAATGQTIAREAGIDEARGNLLPEVIRLSRRTYAVLEQNIAFALGVKEVFFVLAVSGSATMWMAVFAGMGATLPVVAHGLRLLKVRPRERAASGQTL